MGSGRPSVVHDRVEDCGLKACTVVDGDIVLVGGTKNVTVYRKIGHNAAPPKKFFFCTYTLLGKQILSSPSFIAVALAIPAIYRLTVPFVRLI